MLFPSVPAYNFAEFRSYSDTWRTKCTQSTLVLLPAMWQAMFEKTTRLPDQILAESWIFSRSTLSGFDHGVDAHDAMRDIVHENLRRGRWRRPLPHGH